MTTTVNIHEAKTHLSRLLALVEQGEKVIIARAGIPIAVLGPVPRVDIVFGGLKDVIRYDHDEFMAADAEVRAMFDDDLGIDVSP